jgi:hypothetical protein
MRIMLLDGVERRPQEFDKIFAAVGVAILVLRSSISKNPSVGLRRSAAGPATVEQVVIR